MSDPQMSLPVRPIRLAEVRRTFGLVDAVASLSLAIEPGEFLVLLGPSGCGKSTLLRLIAGLETLSAGTIHIGEREVSGLPPMDRGLAFVFQSYALYPHMTVRRNIAFPLIMARWKWWYHLPGVAWWQMRRLERLPEIREAVADAARMLALEDYLDRHPRTLSGGQRQRVAVGRAMVRRPAAFLMDEPLSNLDAKLRAHMRSQIVELHRSLRNTFIYVTHDQTEAMTMADRIAVMRSGKVLQHGTPEEIYERPSCMFVARFVGSPPMNVVPAHVETGMLRIGSQKLALPAGLAVGDGPVFFGVRPDHVRIGGDSGLAGTIVTVERLGHESIYRVVLDGADAPAVWQRYRELTGEEAARIEMLLKEPGYGKLKEGDKIRLSFPMRDAVLFDANTGARLGAGPPAETILESSNLADSPRAVPHE